MITARNTDVGALIDAGAPAAPDRELFFLAQPERLRVYVNVPGELRARGPAGAGRRPDGRRAARPAVARCHRDHRERDRSDHADACWSRSRSTTATGRCSRAPSPRFTWRCRARRPPCWCRPARCCFAPRGCGSAWWARTTALRCARSRSDAICGATVEVTSGLKGDEAVIASPPDSLFDGQTVRIAPQSSRPEAGGAAMSARDDHRRAPRVAPSVSLGAYSLCRRLRRRPGLPAPPGAGAGVLRAAAPGLEAGPALDDLPRGAWWRMFGDPTLDALEGRSRWPTRASRRPRPSSRRRARRSGSRAPVCFPTDRRRAGGDTEPAIAEPGAVRAGGQGQLHGLLLPIDATYEFDVWGRVRRTIEAARARRRSHRPPTWRRFA